MYRRQFWPTIVLADLDCAGGYYFGSGYIEINRKLKGWQFTITLLHELIHWLLDSFHASYYMQIAFDILSERWFPNGGTRSKEFIRYDRKQLAALRHLGLEKWNIRELWADNTRFEAFVNRVHRGRR